MKIVFVFHDRTNYAGGPALNAVRLLPVLKEMGVAVHAICIGPKNDTKLNAQKLIESGIEVSILDRTYFSEELAFNIWKKILAVEPDVVVSNINVQAALLAKWLVKRGIPVIHTHRSDDELNNGVADFLLNKENGWDVQGYVFVNEFLKNRYNDSLHEKAVESQVIHSGVLESNFKTNSESEKLGVIYAGRIQQKQKQVLDIADTFILLSSKYPDILFTMIGSGSEYDQVQNMIDTANAQDRVHLESNLYGDDYKKKLANNQFIFLNSSYEGTPGSLMDGMSCGLIPISTHYEGVEEIITDGYNGFVLNHIRELDALLSRLLTDRSLIKQMSELNVYLIKNKFSVEVAAKKWKRLFHFLKERYAILPKKKANYDFKLPRNNSDLLEHNSWSERSLLQRFFYHLRIVFGHLTTKQR